QDSNLQPGGYEPPALTIELRACASASVAAARADATRPLAASARNDEDACVTAPVDASRIVPRLRDLQGNLRAALRAHMLAQQPKVWSRTVRDDAGDTIFGIDVAAEEQLLEQCAAWGKEQHFVLIGEGLEQGGVEFGRPGRGGPRFRLLVDPIDGTRGLMFDKRSAWCLMGVAPDHGPS